jgi:pyruvate,water dikinase
MDIVWKLAPYGGAGLLASRLLQRVTQGCAPPEDVAAVMRGLQGNVTTDMDLAVGDLADIAQQSPALVRHFNQSGVAAATLLATAGEVAGGPAFLTAWQAFLQRYGMRGPSEIDISRPRWREDSTSLLQMVIGNLQRVESGTHRVHFERLVAEGEAAGKRLIRSARQGRLGWLRGPLVQRLVRVTRHLLPMREHHKFVLIQLFDVVKRAISEAGDLLVAEKRLDHHDDVWFLSLPELIAALEQPEQSVRERIRQRRVEFARFWEMAPPRVITSDGEIPVVQHAVGTAPAGALVGSPVSAGVIEGLAHVVRDPQTEVVQPGEILVAPFTDPGWTPLFINAAGLVTEVGGLMTHGSVIAREYGIPAVVGVLGATKHIRTGQRIRVHGDAGYVEILDAEAVEQAAAAVAEVVTV